MIGYQAPQTTSSVYVCNLPSGTDEALLAEHFGQIGLIKKDKRTGRSKIWIYRDKATNEPKGDATVTYEDPHAATAAVEWFDNKDFHGNSIRVSIAESKTKDAPEQALMAESSNEVSPLVGDVLPVEEFVPPGDFGATGAVPADVAAELAGTGASFPGAGRGRGRGELGGKVWQQEGDWPCPNPRPSSGSGAGGAGRGRGRGGDSGRGGRAGGLFGPNDWNCPMCGNTNWAKRTKCNICNTTKPGHTEGGVREGRAGGYKEFDEAEIEETKRRRRELEEDDGEMYDEFGNLKKKFRLKAKQGTPGQSQRGSFGWDKEELGFVENEKKSSRSRDRESSKDDQHNKFSDRSRGERIRGGGDDRDEYWDRDRARDNYRDSDNKERGRSKERDRDRERGERRGR